MRVGEFDAPLVTATFDSDPGILLNIPGEIDCNNKFGLALDSTLHHSLGLRKALKTNFKRHLIFFPKSHPSARLFLLSLHGEYSTDGWVFSSPDKSALHGFFFFSVFPLLGQASLSTTGLQISFLFYFQQQLLP
jgi:hypothetical protein